MLEALTLQSRLGLPGNPILKPGPPPLQTLVSLRIRGFRSRGQDPLHCLSPEDGAEGTPKGPQSPHSSEEQAPEPRFVCVPTLPQCLTWTNFRTSISLPQKCPPNTVPLPWEGAPGPSRKEGANSSALREGLAHWCDQGGLGLHTHPSGDTPPVQFFPAPQRPDLWSEISARWEQPDQAGGGSPGAGQVQQAKGSGRRLPGRAGRPGS